MRRGVMARVMVALVAIVVAGVALAAVLFLANGSRGFAACSGVAGSGWIVPILAGLVIGTILWLLSAQSPKYEDGPHTDPSPVVCPECGQPVLSSWRLCPECGARQGD